VVGYDVFQNGVWIVSTPANSANTSTVTLTGLRPATPYTFTVRARDASGNVSLPASAALLTTKAPDGSLPTAPADLWPTYTTYTGVELVWTASTDNSGIAAYDVYKEGTRIVTLDGSATSVVIGGLSPGTPYKFTVKARDPQGNVSPASNSVAVTTPPLPPDGAIGNPSVKQNGPWLTCTADFNLPYGFEHVFIDSDNNARTGWLTSSTPSVGAEYMVENETLYKYAGSGTDWVWTVVAQITPRQFRQNTVQWRIPMSSLGNPRTSIAVAFSGNGFAPPASSRVITVTQ